MKHLILPYALALIAKQKGFNEPCFKSWYAEDQVEEPYLKTNVYGNELYELDFNQPFEGDEVQISAPTHQQIRNWLRLNLNIHIEVVYRNADHLYLPMLYPILPRTEVIFVGSTKDHDEALNNSIEKALKAI